MDGTLLGDDGRVSPRNLAALHAAHARGIQLVVATGRRHSFAMRVLRPLGLHNNSILISSNGTVTRTLGARLRSRECPLVPSPPSSSPAPTSPTPPPSGSARHVARRQTSATPSSSPSTAPSPTGKTPAAPWWSSGSTISPPASAAGWPPTSPTSSRSPRSNAPSPTPHDPPIQAMLCGTLERMARAEARLLEHPGVVVSGHPSECSGAPSIAVSSRWVGGNTSEPHTSLTLHRTEYPARDLSILDILPAGCSKGAALLTLARARGIDPAEILAIGDNWNDVSMLEAAGRAVLMAQRTRRPQNPRPRQRLAASPPPTATTASPTPSNPSSEFQSCHSDPERTEGEESPHLPFGLR